MDEKRTSLRKLSLFDATMISSGAMIGAGIFMNSSESAKFLQSSSQLLRKVMRGQTSTFNK